MLMDMSTGKWAFLGDFSRRPLSPSTSQVPAVYELELPPEAKSLLAMVAIGVSFGLSRVDSVLECLGT